MSYTNAELIRRFVQGENSGKCNRMAIAAFEDWTLLWGYGHALYAARRDDGALWVYDGWDGYSQTTSTHMGKVKGIAQEHYGEPTPDGKRMSVVVDGEGGAEVIQRPPSGFMLMVVDADPGTDYGTLDAEGRPELAGLDGRHVQSPSGASSSSRY
jgi:hypothetical protein